MTKPGDTVTVDFTTQNPSTGAAADADSTPTGTLVRNGTDTAEVVTVTNKETGVYKAAVTIPAGYTAGDEVQIRIAATLGGTAGKGVIWGATLDSKRNADLQDLTAAQVNTEVDTALAEYDGPTNAEMEARTIVAASYATAANLATVAGYLDTEIAAILADTNELQTDWADGGRLDLILDARASQTSVDDIPTVAEFNARTLAAADYFDPAADTVANVTTVGSVTTKTGYSLASTGLDLVVPADPSAIPVLGTSSIVAWIGYFGLWSTAEVNSTNTEVTLRNSADSADIATHGTSDDGSVFSSGEAT